MGPRSPRSNILCAPQESFNEYKHSRLQMVRKTVIDSNTVS